MVYQHPHESHPQPRTEEVCKVYQPTTLKDRVLSVKYNQENEKSYHELPYDVRIQLRIETIQTAYSFESNLTLETEDTNSC